MSRISKWFRERRKHRLKEYEEAKKEFEDVVGKPSISINIELPEGCEDMRESFKRLEDDKAFKKKVEKLVIRRLKRERSRK